MIIRNLLGFFTAVLLAIPPATASAQSTVSLSDVAEVALLPGWRTERGTHMAALQVSLAPGWKTYWRSPGDAGIPPAFDWQGSRNLTSVGFHWPTPKIFELNGMLTLAYEGTVIIPIEITPRQGSGGVIGLRGRMDFGVCEEICIPMSVRIQADLLNGGQPDPQIQRALAAQPKPARVAGIGSVTCKISAISDGLQLTATIVLDHQGGTEITVVELADQSIWISEATTKRQGRRISSVVEMVPPNGKPFALARSELRFTVIGGSGAVDIRGCNAG